MACLYRREHSPNWWMRFQVHGVRHQKSTGTSNFVEARRVMREAVRSARKCLGRRAGSTPPQITFEALCDRFARARWPTLTPGTQLNYKGHIAVLRRHFGDLPVSAVGRGLIDELEVSLLERGLTTSTVRGYLTTLSSILRYGERAALIDETEVPRVDKRHLPHARPRDRHLTREEYLKLEACAAPHLRPIMRLAVLTGMRQDEVLGLEWARVDLARREVRLEVTKNKRTRTVPLSDDAVAILVAMTGTQRTGYVFVNPKTGTRYVDVGHAFRRARERAGIEDFRFHDLRHTFASWAIQSGMSLYVLSKILGHSNLAMTMGYAHQQTQQLHDAVQQMSRCVA